MNTTFGGFEHPGLPPGWHWPDNYPETWESYGAPEGLAEYWFAADGTALHIHEYAERLRQVLHYLERH